MISSRKPACVFLIWIVCLALFALSSTSAGSPRLSVDQGRTASEARANPVVPGGTLTVYGTFPWGRDAWRARAYFLPRDQPAQQKYEGRTLLALEGRGLMTVAERVSATEATFPVPDTDEILTGSRSKEAIRVVLVDQPTDAPASSAPVLTLDAAAKEAPVGLFLGSIVGVLVGVLLLLLVLFGVVVVLVVLVLRKKRKPTEATRRG